MANLFLHYAFDEWMRKNYPTMLFERYADDIIVHCRSEKQAKWIKGKIERRLLKCKLELHPEKTKIIYCKDTQRREDYPMISFDFLGFTFSPRLSKTRLGKYFVNFTPGVSNNAAKEIREKVRRWKMHLNSDKSLEDLSKIFSPIIRGWINYYGSFYKSALYPTLRHLNSYLVRWAMRKFKKLKGHLTKAVYWLGRIAKRQPELFPHWQMGLIPTAG